MSRKDRQAFRRYDWRVGRGQLARKRRVDRPVRMMALTLGKMEQTKALLEATLGLRIRNRPAMTVTSEAG
jgi:hypothetical protein